jgi:alkylation response protein AidB-like acyl-CoA dehydrogenase
MMDFGLSEGQKMLRASAADFLGKECPKSKVRELEEDDRGYDPRLWHKMAGEMGWMGLVLPEEYGGAGGDFMELAILLEVMGGNIVPGPFFSTVVLGALPVLEYGTDEQKKRFLPKVASGEQVWSLALTESAGTYEASSIELRASLEQEGYLLTGTKFLVPYAHVADYLLVVARTSEAKERVSIFLVDGKSPGIKIEVISTMARDKLCEVTFNKVRVSKDNILGKIGQGWDIVNFILQRAIVLKCAEVLGACEAVMEMTNTYIKGRVQFDRPIGSFQALQHRMVDRFIDVEGLRYLVYEAAWEVSTGSASSLHISMAKAKANEVYQRTCIDCIKNHGAIGFTADQDIGLYYRRVKAAEFFLGDTDFHRERVAVGLGL